MEPVVTPIEEFSKKPRMARPRVVIKVGSSLLAETPALRPRYSFMHGLMCDIRELKDRGFDVVLTTSGSVALGLKLLRAEAAKAGVQEKQAAAACGQPVLLNAYKQVAQEYDIEIAQVLLTLDDMEDSRRYLNTKNTIDTLLDLGALPIVNENDSVATTEIRVGDNDRLAAKVAQMIHAETFVILTSVDGLYDRNPDDESARLVPVVDDVSEFLEVTSGTNSLGTGGMFTKMQAANMAQNAGCETLIGRGVIDQPVTGLLDNRRQHTRCVAHSTPSSAWALWLTNRLQIAGSLVISDEAARALKEENASLDCRDILSIHRSFSKADVLHVYDESGNELARGLSNFSSDEAILLASNPDSSVESLLGYQAASVIVNARNLVILDDNHLPWDEPAEAPRVIAA